MVNRIVEIYVVRNLNRINCMFFIALLFLATPVWGESKESKQEDIIKMSQETLAELYKTQPSAKKIVEGAPGYAVFSNFGMKIFVAGGGSGSGMTYNNKTKKRTFMKMVEVQAGLGIGVKKFRLVWVFESEELLNQFINSGWELGGQTTAAAKMGEKGADMAGLASHPLPESIRYYSVVTYPDRDHISSILKGSYDKLSLIDARNDSQLIHYDQLIPGSVLLGYLNADHWAIAVPINRSHAFIASTFVDKNAFPREVLLEAIVRFVEEDLNRR